MTARVTATALAVAVEHGGGKPGSRECSGDVSGDPLYGRDVGALSVSGSLKGRRMQSE